MDPGALMDLRNKTGSIILLSSGLSLAFYGLVTGRPTGALFVTVAILIVCGMLTADLRGPRDPHR